MHDTTYTLHITFTLVVISYSLDVAVI